MMILNNEEVSELLSMENCLQHLESAYKELSEGSAVNRPRSDLYLPATTSGGVYCFKTMEGGLTREKVVALRLNSDVIKWEEKAGRIIKDKVPAAPGNKWVGLVLLFSAETGEPLAIFPTALFKGIRVAASSALAARFFAREDATVVGILGSGWQARAHAKAMCAVRDIKKILVHSPTKANREKFAAEVEQELGVPVDAVAIGRIGCRARGYSGGSDQFGIEGGAARVAEAGMHVTCVKITELGEETLRKFDRLVIHTRKWAPDNYITGFNDEKVEAHDPIDLLTEGGKASSVTPKQPFWLGAPELKDVVAGKLPGRQSAKEITCFNNNIGLGFSSPRSAKRSSTTPR